MDSLSSGPIADVLERLHQEAEAADAPLAQAYAGEETRHDQMISRLVESETKDLKGLYHSYARIV